MKHKNKFEQDIAHMQNSIDTATLDNIQRIIIVINTFGNAVFCYEDMASDNHLRLVKLSEKAVSKMNSLVDARLADARNAK